MYRVSKRDDASELNRDCASCLQREGVHRAMFEARVKEALRLSHGSDGAPKAEVDSHRNCNTIGGANGFFFRAEVGFGVSV